MTLCDWSKLNGQYDDFGHPPGGTDLVPGAARLGPPLLAAGILQGQVPVRRRSSGIHQRPRRGPTADHGQRTSPSGTPGRRTAPFADDCGLCDLRGGHCGYGRATLVPDRVHVKVLREFSEESRLSRVEVDFRTIFSVHSSFFLRFKSLKSQELLF